MLGEVEVARVVHAAHNALQVSSGEEAPSQPWDAESAESHATVINGVRFARILMEDWGYWNDMGADTAAASMHEEWCQFKKSQGWVHGEVKDWQAKTHPSLVDWLFLPPHQKLKNRLFLSIVWQLDREKL